MLKTIPLSLLAVALLVSTPACKKDTTAAEANAAKAKAWQEQQKVVAYKAYKEIVDSYPDSPFAAQAKQRLDALGPVATPAPAAKK